MNIFGRVESVFHSEGVSLEYATLGAGTQPMFAFHGFGSTAADFRVLEPSLGRRYKVYSFNLPWHGKSTVDGDTLHRGISTSKLQHFFQAFLSEIKEEKFSLLGFSIGGKICLKLIELFPDQILDIILLAPDGIRISPWYRFVTQTRAGNWVYNRMMLHPKRFMRYVSILETLKVIPPRTANFVRGSLDSKDKRELVYKTWMSLRKLNPDIRKVQSVINEKKPNLYLFFGKYDNVIPTAIGKKFISGLDNKNALNIVDAGHQLIKDKMNIRLSKILKV